MEASWHRWTLILISLYIKDLISTFATKIYFTTHWKNTLFTLELKNEILIFFFITWNFCFFFNTVLTWTTNKCDDIRLGIWVFRWSGGHWRQCEAFYFRTPGWMMFTLDLLAVPPNWIPCVQIGLMIFLYQELRWRWELRSSTHQLVEGFGAGLGLATLLCDVW